MSGSPNDFREISLPQLHPQSPDHEVVSITELEGANRVSRAFADQNQQGLNPCAASTDAVDDKNSSKRKRKYLGGWKAAILLLVNESLQTLAFFGVGVNLVLFLTRVMGHDNAKAANSVSMWTGTVYIFSLLGAFLSDSYWGRYLTCTIFQLIFVLGLVLLSLASWLFLVKPKGCGDGIFQCKPADSVGVPLFYLSIYMVALGYGGYQPIIATFGADQFNENDPVQKHSKSIFFSYFYFALNAGSLISNTFLAYFEDTGYWTIGFIASAGSAVVGLILFWFGTSGYICYKPCGNPLTRVAQVFVAAAKKWKVVVPTDGARLYEVEGSESAIKGSRKIHHSADFRCLDKAATVTDKEMDADKNNPWKICTVTQVEEVKCVLKLLPVWLCTIIYSVVFTQMASLFVEQGEVMYSYIGSFHLPAASMSVFDILSVLICTFLYRLLLVPVTGKITGNPKGLTELQRMGVGLVIGLLAMVAAGFTEFARLKYVQPGDEYSSLSIFWQIPQYALVGASEVFMYVGQLEFFNSQAPDGLKSLGSSLCMASISLGNYVSSFILVIVMGITTKGHRPGWIPNNLNKGHMDRFYFLLALLSAVDFILYLLCAKWYKCINVQSDEKSTEQMEVEDLLTRV